MAKTLVLLLAAVAALVSAQCTDVRIASLADANMIRQSCRVVGNLTVHQFHNPTAHLVLGGIEEITGQAMFYPTSGNFMNISCSTPTRIGDSLSILGRDIKGVSLPKLEYIGRWINIHMVPYLRVLELPSLKRVGTIKIDAPMLESLAIGRLEGFNPVPEPYDGRNVSRYGLGHFNCVMIFAARLESLYSIFARRLDARSPNTKTYVGINVPQLPKLRRIDFAWTNVDQLDVSDSLAFGLAEYGSRTYGSSPGITLVLHAGGGNDTVTRLGRVTVDSGVLAVERQDDAPGATLEAESFYGQPDPDMARLDVPFDRLPALRVHGIRRPHGSTKSASFLETRNPDAADSTTRPKVLQHFEVYGQEGSDFSCEPFDRLKAQGILPSTPGNYSCSVTKSGSARVKGVSWVAVMSVAVGALVL